MFFSKDRVPDPDPDAKSFWHGGAMEWATYQVGDEKPIALVVVMDSGRVRFWASEYVQSMEEERWVLRQIKRGIQEFREQMGKLRRRQPRVTRERILAVIVAILMVTLFIAAVTVIGHGLMRIYL